MSKPWGNKANHGHNNGGLFGPIRSDAKGAPDLTDSILGAVDTRRGFISGRSRRVVTTGRLVAGLVVVGLVATAAIIQQAQPAWATWTNEVSPVSEVFSCSQTEVASSAERFRAATECLLPAATECGLLVLPYIPAPEELAIAAAQAGTRTLGYPFTEPLPSDANAMDDQGFAVLRASLSRGGLSPVSDMVGDGSVTDTPLGRTHAQEDDSYIP